MYTMEIFSDQKEIINNQWTFYPKLQTKGKATCGHDTILGSTEIKYRSLTMSRKFTNLPTHRGVSLHFYFYQIDDFDEGLEGENNFHRVYFKIGGKIIPYTVSQIKKQLCGN